VRSHLELLVHPDVAARSRAEVTSRGFHVISWASGGFGMALVSDIGWDDSASSKPASEAPPASASEAGQISGPGTCSTGPELPAVRRCAPSCQ
jgi:hypothetical protein